MTPAPEPKPKSTARVKKSRAIHAAKGMIRFDKWVTPEQLEAIKAMLAEWEAAQ